MPTWHWSLTIVKGLKTKTPLSVVKGHSFMRPALGREKDLRKKGWGKFVEEMERWMYTVS
jgi:hypothetical protein